MKRNGSINLALHNASVAFPYETGTCRKVFQAASKVKRKRKRKANRAFHASRLKSFTIGDETIVLPKQDKRREKTVAFQVAFLGDTFRFESTGLDTDKLKRKAQTTFLSWVKTRAGTEFSKFRFTFTWRVIDGAHVMKARETKWLRYFEQPESFTL